MCPVFRDTDPPKAVFSPAIVMPLLANFEFGIVGTSSILILPPEISRALLLSLTFPSELNNSANSLPLDFAIATPFKYYPFYLTIYTYLFGRVSFSSGNSLINITHIFFGPIILCYH